MNQIREKFESVMGSVATWAGENIYLKAITDGFMNTMPIILGCCIFAIVGNLPIQPWTDFLNQIGLYTVIQQFISATSNLLGLYVVGTIAYSLTKSKGQDPVVGLVICLAAYVALVPLQYVELGENNWASMFNAAYFGSNGIFAALLVGLLISSLYCWLMSKNLVLKLPASVPPMVTRSLAPTFAAMIIFTIVLAIKYAFTLTGFGNLFDMITQIIVTPILKFGASPIAFIGLYTLCNLCWFFGIHPSPLLNAYVPVLTVLGMKNMEAFLTGQPLPDPIWPVVYACCYIGGTGNTLGLCLASLFAKSQKYKELRKLCIPPNIFNINEPIIFGFPVMLNPIYFVPMVLSSVVSGGIGWILAYIVPYTLNPAAQTPWIMPGFIQAFLQGGIGFMIIWLVCLAAMFLLYLPFFKMDDARAFQEEQAMGIAEEEKELVLAQEGE